MAKPQFRSTARPQGDEPEPEDVPVGKLPEVIEKTFDLDGEEFAWRAKGDADSILEWSEIADIAMEAGDAESPNGVILIARFLKVMMEAAEYRRLRAHFKKHKTPGHVIVEIMGMMNDTMEELVEKATERPTKGRSSSSGGAPTAEDERRLQIISLAGIAGDVEFMPAPPADAPHPEPTPMEEIWPKLAGVGG